MPRGKGFDPVDEAAPSAPTAKGRGAGQAEVSFEEALARLEDVVGRLERGDQPLEEALRLFEEGVRLSRLLTAKLEAAQARIDRLVATRNGGATVRPFAVGEGGDVGDAVPGDDEED